jgi:pyruvate-formate lyase-activating enzyme
VTHADPIERKPLYHVLPGTTLLSLGTLGCNMTCDFCQNWRISQARPTDDGEVTPPEAVVATALEQGCSGIAFTYNEPTIYLDYAVAIMTLARQAGLITAFKTNGYLTPEAIDALTVSDLPLSPCGRGGRLSGVGFFQDRVPMRSSPHPPSPLLAHGEQGEPPQIPLPDAVRSPSPAQGEGFGVRAPAKTLHLQRGGRGVRGTGSLLTTANVDLKGFNDDYYRTVCGARLQPVLDAIEHLHRRGVWVEVTTLIIPGVNDSDGELRALTQWLASVSPDIPWHVWRFHPDYRMTDVAWTHVRDVERAITIGRDAGLRYVYASNLPGDPNQHTYCPGCGARLIERRGNATVEVRMDEGKCGVCARGLPGLLLPHEVA